MHVYLYISTLSDTGKDLLRHVEQKVDQAQLSSFVSLTEMSSQLRTSVRNRDIVIFLAATANELDHLIEMHDVLEDVRLILVLPDSMAETVASAHLLRPRFLTYADHDMAEVSSVLENMIRK